MGDLFRCHRPGCPIAAPHVCPVDDPAEYLPSAPKSTPGSPVAPGDPGVPDAAHRSDVAAIEIIGQHTPQPDGNGGKVLRRPADVPDDAVRAREAEIRATLDRRRPPCPVDARHDVQWRPAQGVSGSGWMCDIDGYLPDPAPTPLVGESGPEHVQLGAGTLTYNIPSGVPWATQIRALLDPWVDDVNGALDAATAEVAAWFDAAGGVRYRQGYAAGASDRGQVR